MIRILSPSNDSRIRDTEERSGYVPFWHSTYQDWYLVLGSVLVLVSVVSYSLTGEWNWRPSGNWAQTIEMSDMHEVNGPPVIATK